MPAAKPRPGTLGTGETLDLEALLGSSWQGFYLVGRSGEQGQLQHALWRRPFDAGELVALFWKSQQVEALEFEVRQLRQDLQRANERAERAEAAASFYRHELRAASKLGLMFSAIEDR